MSAFTRNAPAPYIDENGQQKTAGKNEPRWTHRAIYPHDLLGLLIESGEVNGTGYADELVDNKLEHYSQDDGTFLVDFEWSGVRGGLFEYGGPSSALGAYVDADGSVIASYSSAVDTVSFSVGMLYPSQRARLAVVYRYRGLWACLNGGYVSGASATVLGPFSYLKTGFFNDSFLNGPLLKLDYDWDPFNNEKMVEITSGDISLAGLRVNALLDAFEAVLDPDLPVLRISDE